MKKSLVLISLFTVLYSTLLLVFLKGNIGLSGNLRYQSDRETNVGGPFESTNSNSRYALVEAIVNNKTFFLSNELAKFSTPDIARVGDKYISIFTPGVSFLAVPFYYIGKLFEVPQLATYLCTMLLAIVNALLISVLARRLGTSSVSSYVAGFLFLFGTNALPYALTLTQHHAGIFILLLSVLNASLPRTLLRNMMLGALFGAGLLIDIPNGLILLPVIIYAISRHFVRAETNEGIRFRIKLSFIGMLLGLLPLLYAFGVYNYQTTGSYTLIGQTVGRFNYPIGQMTEEIPVSSEIIAQHKKLPYETRNLLSGFYTLLVSNERGWVYYSPIVLFGFLGLAFAYRNKNTQGLTAVVMASTGMTVLSYAMFGDPWGGWSFGPRYLLPATALVCTGIAVAVDKYRSNIVLGILLVATSIYSISVNVLGALTTNAIPPKVEAVNLQNPIPYTYIYNLDFLLNKNTSSSLIYNLWLADRLSAFQYFLIVAGVTGCIFIVMYITSVVSLKRKS